MFANPRSGTDFGSAITELGRFRSLKDSLNLLASVEPE